MSGSLICDSCDHVCGPEDRDLSMPPSDCPKCYGGRLKRHRPPTVPVVTLSPDLARRLRAAAKKVLAGTEERNRLIVEAAEAGASLREIAAEVGLDHTGVRKIVLKAKD